MTVVRPNSIAGINSITVQTGQALNIHDASGNLIRNIVTATGVGTFHSIEVGSAATVNNSGQINSTNIIVSAGSSIGIGTDRPDTLLHVYKSGVHGGTHAHTDAPLLVENNGNCVIDIASSHTGIGGVYFSDTGASGKGKIEYQHGDDYMKITANGSEAIRITSDGDVILNRSGNDLASAHSANGLYVVDDDSNYTSIACANTGTGDANIYLDASNGDLSGGDYCMVAQNNDLDMVFRNNESSSDIIFQAGGTTERLRITSAGSVGINSSSPNRAFTIYSDSTTRMNLKSQASGTCGIEFGDPADENVGYMVYHNSTDFLKFGTSAGDRAGITGVGTFVAVRDGATLDAYAGSVAEFKGSSGGGSSFIRLTNHTTTAKSKTGIVFTTTTGDYSSAGIFHQRSHGPHTTDALVFATYAGSGNPGGATGQSSGLDDMYEGMRLFGTNSSSNTGGVGIGTSSPAQRFLATGHNSNGSLVCAAPLGSNAMTLVPWRSHTAGVGNDIIGLNFAGNNYYNSANKSGVFYQLLAENDHGSYGDRGRMRFNPGYDGNSTTDGKSLIMSFGGTFFPNTDDACDLGASGNRWDDLYATNSSIQTSDETLKQDIVGLTTAEMNAAKRISALFKTYKWKAAVSSKGSNARTHVGVTAQSVKAALEAESLDPTKYAFYTKNTIWRNSDGETVGDGFKTGPGTYDELTKTTQPIPDASSGITSSTTYGVRYGELTSFVNAYNEQRFTSIESRLAALESA